MGLTPLSLLAAAAKAAQGPVGDTQVRGYFLSRVRSSTA
jgi:hypothetical protein